MRERHESDMATRGGQQQGPEEGEASRAQERVTKRDGSPSVIDVDAMEASVDSEGYEPREMDIDMDVYDLRPLLTVPPRGEDLTVVLRGTVERLCLSEQ